MKNASYWALALLVPLAAASCSARAVKQAGPETTVNSIGMKLTLIPAGEFQMGGSESVDELVKQFPYVEPVKNYLTAEHPRHRVRITRPFYLGTCEVTLRQFRSFVASTGYRTEAERDGKGGWGYDQANVQKPISQKPEYTWRNWGHPQSEDEPVVNVSWNDAVAFCQWLSNKESKTYRLPTEAEWEYACRAGTTTRYPNGDDPERLTQVANVADATTKEKISVLPNTLKSSDGFAFAAPVGSFKPNAFGLYDMHGNAAEWCSDWFGEDYYRRSPDDDPQGPDSGSMRVFRGGGWLSRAVFCRSAYRARVAPTARIYDVGFRVVRVFQQ